MKTDLQQLSSDAGDELQIHYVSLDSLKEKFLEGNSKKHDFETLSESINRYSFRDPIAFDSTLNDGSGGIVEGNGRLEWLTQARGKGEDAPRGIRTDNDQWFVPVVFGVNSESEGDAVAYSVSHNLSALWGSGLTFLEQSQLFDEDLLKNQLEGLTDLDMVPVGISEDDLSTFLGLEGGDAGDDADDNYEEDEMYQNKYGVLVECNDATHQEEIYNLLSGQGHECKILTV